MDPSGRTVGSFSHVMVMVGGYMPVSRYVGTSVGIVSERVGAYVGEDSEDFVASV